MIWWWYDMKWVRAYCLHGIQCRPSGHASMAFWPTALSVTPLATVLWHTVYLSVCLWRFVLCQKERIGNQGQKVDFFRWPPYFYFRFCLYGHWDGPFCLIFARSAQQSVLYGTNGRFCSKLCAYCQIVRSEMKPEVVLATIIDLKGENSLKMPINGLRLPCLQVLLAQISFSVSCKVASHNRK